MHSLVHYKFWSNIVVVLSSPVLVHILICPLNLHPGQILKSSDFILSKTTTKETKIAKCQIINLFSVHPNVTKK
jgi:hypothetical protein